MSRYSDPQIQKRSDMYLNKKKTFENLDFKTIILFPRRVNQSANKTNACLHDLYDLYNML